MQVEKKKKQLDETNKQKNATGRGRNPCASARGHFRQPMCFIFSPPHSPLPPACPHPPPPIFSPFWREHFFVRPECFPSPPSN